MGALTLKSLSFYVRNWDTEKSESTDPTDGFGSNTRVYVNNNKIILIEPEYNIHNYNTWLSDKGRQFFDGMFEVLSKNSTLKNKTLSDSWTNITKILTRIVYLYNQCTIKKSNKFFTIIFENLSLEVLSFLIVISQNYYFVNLKRAENYKTNNDLESNYQLNLTSNNKTKLANSATCLLVSTNPRYEGYFLNLSLRQRFFKGNFKCLLIGSVINLTFPITFLGSNLNITKTIAEGTNLTCQTLKSSINNIAIYNNEILKRLNNQNLIESLKMLKYSNIFLKSWNNLNSFSSTLSETGIQSLAKFLSVTKIDLSSSGVIYFLNLNTSNISNLKQIINFKLLNLNKKNINSQKFNALFLDQSPLTAPNLEFSNKLSLTNNNKLKYFFLPTSLFYENEETLINTEGLIKKTVKIIFRKKTKNNWQLLRKIFKHLKTNINFLDKKSNNLLFFNSKNISLFRNFVNFNYQATQSLLNLNFYLINKTRSFTITYKKFKSKTQKYISTKVKYWLDDFYSGGRDEYSQTSLVLANCSSILRTKSTNFF